MKTRIFYLAAILAILTLVSVSLVARADQPPQPTAVQIDNFTFAPEVLTVRPGTEVRWTNHDDMPHTIVSDGNFKSSALDTDDAWSHTFTKPGEYAYYCSIHPKMTGKIVVK